MLFLMIHRSFNHKFMKNLTTRVPNFTQMYYFRVSNSYKPIIRVSIYIHFIVTDMFLV